MTPDESYLIAVVGRELYRATLVGDPSPASLRAQLAGRMRNPRPGDLVLEVSPFSQMTPERFDPDRIGRLIRTEAVDPLEAVHEGEERQVVAPLHDPQREQGWRNATFIALPDWWNWTKED
jgi:hypothetical protein